jgi:hypothetical protein
MLIVKPLPAPVPTSVIGPAGGKQQAAEASCAAVLTNARYGGLHQLVGQVTHTQVL